MLRGRRDGGGELEAHAKAHDGGMRIALGRTRRPRTPVARARPAANPWPSLRTVFAIVMPMTAETAVMPTPRDAHHGPDHRRVPAAPASEPFLSAHQLGLNDAIADPGDADSRAGVPKQSHRGRSSTRLAGRPETSQALDERRKTIKRSAPDRRAGVHMDTLMTNSTRITPRAISRPRRRDPMRLASDPTKGSTLSDLPKAAAPNTALRIAGKGSLPGTRVASVSPRARRPPPRSRALTR